MATLLYTNKLQLGSPSKSTSFKVERFNTDSYSVRATVGINPVVAKYTLSWAGISPAELTALTAQLNAAAGVGTVDYTPPDVGASQKFTVASYSFNEYPGVSRAYQVTAELTREFDI